MTKQHATLSPSSSARWLTCPGSLRVIDEVFPDGAPDQSSVYAQEGTFAHELAEQIAGLRLKVGHDKASFEPGEDPPGFPNTGADMLEHANFYADTLENIVQTESRSMVMLEQRVNTGIEGVWGTADCIIVAANTLYVVDYKYGRGVQVASDENTQMMLYALGAMNYVDDIFGDALGEITEIRMVIIQPRTHEPVSESTIEPAALKLWATEVAAPQAALALNREGPVVPSEDACRWCPAAGACAVRAEAVVMEDFGIPEDLTAPEAMTPEALAEALAAIPEIERWCKQVREYAQIRLYDQGKPIPGYKTVWNPGSRKIVDTEAAIKKLMAKGYRKRDISRTNLQTLGVLDKLVGGKDELATALGDLLTTGEGKPAIVPEEDKRSAVTKADTAAEEFTNN